MGSIKLNRAEESYGSGDYQTAASYYIEASERLPSSCSFAGKIGQALWLSNQPREAVLWFSEGETCQRLTLDDWLAYGDSLEALNEGKAAIMIWERSILGFGPSFGANNRIGMTSLRLGDYPSAIKYLDLALQSAPEDAATHFQLGLLLMATDPEKSLPELIIAADLKPELESTTQMIRTELNSAFLIEDRAYLLTTSGRLLATVGEWDLAIEAFRRAIGENDQYAEAWAWLGVALVQTGADGRYELEKALILDPLSTSIQALDGLYWMKMGMPGNAKQAYERAAVLEPKNPIWQISLGDVATASGDLLTALQYYYNAIGLAPDDPAAWRALALFSLDNDLDVKNTGLAAAQKLFFLVPDEWMTYLIAGRISNLLGGRIEARTLFLKAIDLSPQEPAVHYYLALAYLESGMISLAYDKLQDTITLDPDSYYSWQAQRILEQFYP